MAMAARGRVMVAGVGRWIADAPLNCPISQHVIGNWNEV